MIGLHSVVHLLKVCSGRFESVAIEVHDCLLRGIGDFDIVHEWSTCVANVTLSLPVRPLVVV
jgi:hypothetical protein